MVAGTNRSDYNKGLRSMHRPRKPQSGGQLKERNFFVWLQGGYGMSRMKLLASSNPEETRTQ